MGIFLISMNKLFKVFEEIPEIILKKEIARSQQATRVALVYIFFQTLDFGTGIEGLDKELDGLRSVLL